MKSKAVKQRMVTTFLSFFLCISFLFAQKNTSYVVDITKIKAQVPGTLWGLFFEDINRSADGGVYADLVKNRSFDFPNPFMGWITEPERRVLHRIEVFQVSDQSSIHPDNPKYLQVTINAPEKITLTNEGFGGIIVKKERKYNLNVVIREHIPGITLKVDIVNTSGNSVGGAILPLTNLQNKEWTAINNVGITTTDSAVNGKLVIRFEGKGKIDIDRISLFPTDTWKNREQGLRNDLVQKLADIQPGFLRFPGGCIVEGENLATRYQWKKTIGSLEERKLILNVWQKRMPSKLLPDYFQSFGLGFYEYFQLCEDLKTEPLPILNCGISCQFEGAEVVPIDQIDPYVQDALDLIEFANGDSATKWGAKRAAMGHADPFNMKMIGVGNENWGPQYVERLQLFTKVIKERYPQIQIITSTGLSTESQFKYMDSVLRASRVDIIDEHYYETPDWFFKNANKYDHYDRSGPKIFLGEYACHSVRIGSLDNKNTQLCALAEAAFMTGLERNADIVTMAAYAPLFAHVKDWQWTPNLIWFDNSSSYATPSYYVQQLFSLNKGTHVALITGNGNIIAGVDSVWASAVIDKNKNEVIIKLVNPSGAARQKTIEIPNLKKKNSTGTITILKGNANDLNSIEQPDVLKPLLTNAEIKNRKIKMKLDAYSFNVIRIKIN